MYSTSDTLTIRNGRETQNLPMTIQCGPSVEKID